MNVNQVSETIEYVKSQFGSMLEIEMRKTLVESYIMMGIGILFFLAALVSMILMLRSYGVYKDMKLPEGGNHKGFVDYITVHKFTYVIIFLCGFVLSVPLMTVSIRDIVDIRVNPDMWMYKEIIRSLKGLR